jgi:hypothetical protein
MPVYSAAEAKDDSDPLAIAVSCVVVIGIIAEGIHKELKGRRELREWPRLAKHWHEDCTGPVIRSRTGAITSNHSPQMATEDDASVNPVAESGGDSADDEVEHTDGTAAASTADGGAETAEPPPDSSPVAQVSTGAGLKVLVAAAKFKRAHKRDTGHIPNATVAAVFKGVIMDEHNRPENPYGLLQALLGVPQSIGLPSLIISNLGERLGLSSDEWNAWFGGGSVVTALAVFAIIGPEYLCPISSVWALISLGMWFGTVVVIMAVFIFKSTVSGARARPPPPPFPFSLWLPSTHLPVPVVAERRGVDRCARIPQASDGAVQSGQRARPRQSGGRDGPAHCARTSRAAEPARCQFVSPLSSFACTSL